MKSEFQVIQNMINTRDFLAIFLVFATLALCFVWPIPNNQILFHRNWLIYPIALVSFVCFFSFPIAKQSLDFSKTKFVFVVISLLTLFILINGILVAPDIKKMIFAWNGQWLRPVLLFFTGVSILPVLQSRFSSISASYFLTLIILFFWGVICIHSFDSIWLYWRDSMIHWGETRIVYNRTRMSFQINMITSFLLAELLARNWLNRCFLCLKTSFLIIMLLCNLICTVLVDTRWGTIGAIGNIFCTVILFVIYSMRNNRKLITSGILFTVTTIAISVLLIYVSLSTDYRWHSLKTDAIAGWNATLNSFCYIKTDEITPINDLGSFVNHSNSCRASFFHQGWKLVVNNLVGIGPRKEAFRYALCRNSRNCSIIVPHSHYGLIEFGIQNGVVGIIGWLFLLAGYWYIGWHEFRHGEMIVGVFLITFIFSFFSRSMVDHNLKDHCIEQYMFLTGLLIGMCSLRTKTT